MSGSWLLCPHGPWAVQRPDPPTRAFAQASPLSRSRRRMASATSTPLASLLAQSSICSTRWGLREMHPARCTPRRARLWRRHGGRAAPVLGLRACMSACLRHRRRCAPPCAPPQEPCYDSRLPVREDRPDLNFNVKHAPVATNEQWKAVSACTRIPQAESAHARAPAAPLAAPAPPLANPSPQHTTTRWLRPQPASKAACCSAAPQLVVDQPWTASKRRQHIATYLLAKLEANDDVDLAVEGCHGFWELSINKDHHPDIAFDRCAGCRAASGG